MCHGKGGRKKMKFFVRDDGRGGDENLFVFVGKRSLLKKEWIFLYLLGRRMKFLLVTMEKEFLCFFIGFFFCPVVF